MPHQIAAQHADAVDRDARCPSRRSRRCARAACLARWCRPISAAWAPRWKTSRRPARFSAACASSAMVFAMHQIQVACIVNHAADQGWHKLFLQQLVRHQWLLASATSEDGVGGNLRASQCALETSGGEFRLRKSAPTISYGDYADGILATARRDADAPASEQVLVTLLRDGTLTRRGEWDTLGMRGTCSNGFGSMRKAPPSSACRCRSRRSPRKRWCRCRTSWGRGLDRRGRRRVPPRAPVLPRPARPTAHRRPRRGASPNRSR